MSSTHITHIDLYKATLARLRTASYRGEDTEAYEFELSAIWSMMSESDRRTVLGVGEPHEAKDAA